jgi:hypothetical protein
MAGRDEGREGSRTLRAVLRHLLDSDGWYAGSEGGCTKDPGLALFERVPLTRNELRELDALGDPAAARDALFNGGA